MIIQPDRNRVFKARGYLVRSPFQHVVDLFLDREGEPLLNVELLEKPPGRRIGEIDLSIQRESQDRIGECRKSDLGHLASLQNLIRCDLTVSSQFCRELIERVSELSEFILGLHRNHLVKLPFTQFFGDRGQSLDWLENSSL